MEVMGNLKKYEKKCNDATEQLNRKMHHFRDIYIRAYGEKVQF